MLHLDSAEWCKIFKCKLVPVCELIIIHVVDFCENSGQAKNML